VNASGPISGSSNGLPKVMFEVRKSAENDEATCRHPVHEALEGWKNAPETRPERPASIRTMPRVR